MHEKDALHNGTGKDLNPNIKTMTTQKAFAWDSDISLKPQANYASMDYSHVKIRHSLKIVDAFCQIL